MLLAEDDRAIRHALERALTLEGYEVTAVADGVEALAQAHRNRPDVLVLDVMMPGIDGLQVCRVLRAEGDRTPILMLTALVETADRIAGLDAGADDYVVKPYTAAEMAARIRAMLRRSRTESARPGPLRIGGLEIDPVRREASVDGRPLDLTRLEFDLLAYLAGREGEVVSRRQLLAEVWKQPYGGGDKTIDVHVAWLRRKLGESATEPRYLHTVRGVGVKLVDPTP